MNILLTGHAGFIGSHTLNRLLKRHTITAVDLRVPVRSETTANHTRQSFRSIQGDLSDDAIYQQLDNQSFDTIIHLAALSESALLSKNPALLFRSNIAATHKLLRYAIAHGVDHFIFASSSSIENQTAYTKTGAETLAKAYHTQYDLAVTTLRFPTVYDQRQTETAPLTPIERNSHSEQDAVRQTRLQIKDAVNVIEQTLLEPTASHRLIDLNNHNEVTVAKIIHDQ